MNRRSLLKGLAALPAMAGPAGGTRAADRVRTISHLVGVPLDHPVVAQRMGGLKGRLAALGWVEGKTIRFVLRSVVGDPGQLPAVAAEIVRENPDIIVAGSSTETEAMLAATRSIPVLFSTASDPVGSGFVRSVERPDGNATGYSNNDPSMASKWIELLTEMAPSLRRVGAIFNPATAPAAGKGYIAALAASAGEAGLALVPAPISRLDEIESRLDALAAEPATGLFFMPDSFTFRNARAIARMVGRRRMPAMYLYDAFVQEGGLMSYSGGRDDTDQILASYIDLILRGANVAELPVQFSRSFELLINERTAAELGLVIPSSLRVRATRLIS